jgi:hypothetical protein
MQENEVDVIRAILLELSGRPREIRWAATPVGGYTEDQTLRGVKAAMDENLMVGMFSPSGKIAIVYRMTTKGDEFLEAAKHIGNWNRSKELIRLNGQPMSVAFVWSALTQLQVESAIGLREPFEAGLPQESDVG